MIGLALLASTADAYVSVKGYYKKDGTYVAPYVRSNPNGLKSDNYGYTGGEVYNSSYGTKGATWDTPTTITDPDYYEGKNYYETKTTPMSFTPVKSDTPPIASPYLQHPAYQPTYTSNLPAGCTSVVGYSPTTGIRCNSTTTVSTTPTSTYKYTPVVASPKDRKFINEYSVDYWTDTILDAYNGGKITWDKALELYAYMMDNHD